MRIFLFIALALVLGGCSPTPPGILQGNITIGPICPVERIPPAPECQPTPQTYASFPIVAEGKIIVDLKPASDSSYRVELPPGTYVVKLKNPSPIGQSSLPTTVVISSGKVVNLDISIDTGIR
jgi:hypothetical protein